MLARDPAARVSLGHPGAVERTAAGGLRDVGVRGRLTRDPAATAVDPCNNC
jgi:hypothetical protein